MKLLDLFSGIGGFSLAARWTGRIETVSFCETDPYCCRVLAKNFPGVPIYGDIRKLKGVCVGPADIVSGGFPCQPFSVAGKRRRTQDDRWLWPEMLRVIQEIHPRWVIGENVPGLDDKYKMVLDQVCLDLEGIGYEVAPPFEIPACAVNGDHLRFRIFIVAHSKCNSIQRWAIDTAEGKEESRAEQLAGLLFPASRASISVARTYRDGHGVRSRMDARRNKALGNAIVPQVAYEIMMAILAADADLPAQEWTE